MKRISTIFLAFILCLSNISGIAVMAKSDTSNVASIDFGRNNKLTNVAKATVSGPNTPTTAEGKEALQIDWSYTSNQQVDKNAKIMIDLSDKYFNTNTDGSAFEITVEYLDKSNGFFNIKYDSLSGEAKYTDTCYMGVTNVLKQKTFVINDANFANNLDGYDLILGFPDQIYGRTATEATFTNISVKRIPAKCEVRADIEMEEVGHIYNPQTPVKVNNALKNFSSVEKKVDVKFSAVSTVGEIEWEDQQQLTLSSGEVKELETVPEITRFGLYNYIVEITGDNGYIFKNSTPFSYIRTDADGIVNEKLGYATHINSTMKDEQNMLDAIDVIKKSNVNLVRDSYAWAYTERAKGTYTFSDAADMQLRLQAENGIRTMFVGGYGTTVYGAPTDRYLPQTDEEIKAYANWADAVINRYGGDETFLWEIWNEPNMDVFAKNGNPENYAKFAAKAGKLIKEKHPGTKLGALSLTGMQVPEKQTREYVSKSIEAGVFDYVESAALHPYITTMSPEGSNMMKDMKEHVDLFRQAGYDEVDVWNTEVGWSTANSHGASWTSRDQSAFLAKMYVMLDGVRANEYFIVYDLIDDGNRMTEREDLFGIVANFKYPITGVPFSADEAYVSLTNMNYMLAGCEYPNIIETGKNNLYAYKYRNDRFNKDIIAFWREKKSDNETIHAKLGCKSLVIVDNYGNETEIYSETGEYDLVPDYQISYLVGDFTTAVFEESDVKISGLNIGAVEGDRIHIDISGLADANVDAEILGNDNVKLVSQSVDNGTLRLSVESLKTDTKTQELWIALKKSDKNIMLVKFEIELSDNIVSAVFDTSPSSLDDVSRWDGYVNIKNNSTTKTVDGYVTLLSPSSGNANRVYTGPIPAAKTARVKVSMPRIYDRGLKPIKYKIDMSSGQTFEFEDVGNFAYAPHTTKTPDVDGILNSDEWNKKLYFEVNQKSQVKQITDWAGVNDLSAKIYTAWDEDNFYIAVEAKDNVFYQDKEDASIWMGDSLQFGLVYGTEGFIGIGNAGTKYSEIGAALTPKGPQMYRWSSEDGSHNIGVIENCDVNIVRDKDTETTVYEIALPWEEILPQGFERIEKNASLGFSLLINDNDGTGRRGWIEYASGIGLKKDTSLFTYLGLYDLR